MKKKIQTLISALGYAVQKKAVIDATLAENRSLRQRVADLEEKQRTLVVHPTEWQTDPRFAVAGLAGAALEKLIRDYDFQSVVDIGAGEQIHSELFAKFGKQVTAVDLGTSKFHRQKTSHGKESIVEILGDFNSIDFPECYDCVWASHVLEHQLDVGAFLSKALSILKEGGVLAITVPPFKHEIVGGHVSMWNAGLLLYRLVLAGIDCKNASVLSYGYNISIIVRKKSIEVSKIPLEFDCGDIRKIKQFLPEQLSFNSNLLDDPFNGDIQRINWEAIGPLPIPVEAEDASPHRSSVLLNRNPDTQISGSFYDLDLSARRALVEKAVDARETLVSRWQTLAAEKTDSWAVRAQFAAAMLGKQSSVVDLGCGMMTLERFLSPTTVYIPVDVVSRDTRTVIVDLNKQELPDFGADCVVGLGLIEYIFDVPKLLFRMSACYDTALLSYNSIDKYPNQDERDGHAWVNHFSIAEIEDMLLKAGFRIDDCLQHDASQTIWKLTSTKRVEPIDSSTSPHASKIIFTCDFLRTDSGMEFKQRSNAKKIFEIMEPYVRASTTLPIFSFPDFSDDEYKQFVRSAYEVFNLVPSLESWARTYHVSCLYMFSHAEQRMVDLLKEIFSDSIVISFEASPMLKRVFERCAISYIDVRAHSERFMKDLPLAFMSNSQTVRNALNVYAHPREEFERECSVLRHDFSETASLDNIPKGTVVFLAQTQYDSSVILPNGEFFDVRPYLQHVKEILESYESNSLLIKPHPLDPNCEVVKALLTLSHARLTDENIYRLMSSNNVSAFITFSSSAGHEAECFQKSVHWISTQQPIREYIPIMFEYRTSNFWSVIFRSLNAPMAKSLPECDTHFEPDFIRRKFSITWDARSTLRS